MSFDTMQQPALATRSGQIAIVEGVLMAAARCGRSSRASVHSCLADEVGELRRHLGGLPLPVEAEDI